MAARGFLFVGALIGLALGVLVSLATDVPFAPEVGLVLGRFSGGSRRAGQGAMQTPRDLLFESGRRDLNSGPLVPQTSALTRLRHAPSVRTLAHRLVSETAARRSRTASQAASQAFAGCAKLLASDCQPRRL